MNDKEKQDQAPINVWGIANIGCTMENVTFQTLAVAPEGTKMEEAEVVEDAEGVSVETDHEGIGFVADEKAIDKCFKFNNDFVKRCISRLIADCYHGNYANLALIEITLFHHQQLKRRNSHTAFVMSLAALGIITIADDKEFELIVMGVGDKYKRLPKEGYKEWDDNYKEDRLACERIGEKLGSTMPYQA